jgi:hypothetical protein
MTKNKKILTAEKKFVEKIAVSCPYASINDAKLEEKPSAFKREHLAL